MADYTYEGRELELFSNARKWKQYFSSILIPYIQGSVLEVGAGIGGSTITLVNNSVDSWTCLEPDPILLMYINAKIRDKELPDYCHLFNGRVNDLPPGLLYDTVLYIDVIEHIEDDRLELEQVIRFLKPGGHLLILVPAIPILYSSFDKNIGHFRRYRRKTLKLVIPGDMQQVWIKYLDSMGFIASLANKLFQRKPTPSESQVVFWDKLLVPLSKCFDKITFHRFGKSIIGCWQKKK